MLKQITSLVIIFFISQITVAKVIELDNHNITHCQEQLKNNDWINNVAMLYVKNSPGTNEFRAIYEQVSTEYPKRHLFALNVFDPKADAKENKLIWETVQGCMTNIWYRSEKFMGDINSKTPALLLDDYASAKVGVDMPQHKKLLTKKDILIFIGEKSRNCHLADGININTIDRTLTICERSKAINEFNISLGRKGTGKHSDGDKKTPIGLYKLGTPRQSHRFGIFIPILYPTPQQISAGYTGKDVGIHGPFQLFSWLGFLNTWFNWTQGCVAVGDNEQIALITKWVEMHPEAMILIE